MRTIFAEYNPHRNSIDVSLFLQKTMRSCTTLTSTRQRTSNPALTAAPAKSKRKASPIPSANITGLTRRTILSAMSPGGAAGGSCPS